MENERSSGNGALAVMLAAVLVVLLIGGGVIGGRIAYLRIVADRQEAERARFVAEQLAREAADAAAQRAAILQREREEPAREPAE